MVAVAALIVWRLSPFIVLPIWLIFATLDCAFLSSALVKVPTGAWFTLLLAAILSSIFVLWRYGKEQQWAAEAGDRVFASELITGSGSDSLALTHTFGSTSLTSIRGFAIFFDKIGDPKSIPHIFTQYITKFVSIPQVSVFLHLRPLSTPFVDPDQRYVFSETGIPNTYHLIIRYGYTDEVITEDLASLVANQLKQAVTSKVSHIREVDSSQEADSAVSGNHSADPEAFAALLDEAYENQVLYILGKEQMRLKTGTNVARSVLLGIFMWIRENTRNKMASLKLGGDGLVELGFVKSI